MEKRILLSVLFFLLAACSGQSQADTVATIVAATLQANPPAAPEVASSSPAALTGVMEGKLCFPSEGIPPMNLYLQQAGAAEPVVVPIAQNQTAFSAEVPAGTYTAFAWLPDFSFGGSYSQMVSCGLSADCSDHTLLSFEVTGGAATAGIDVCDWYGNPGDVPLPPGAEVQSAPGSIAGSLSYPSEMIPAMQVVAFSADSDIWFVSATAYGQASYQIDNLPAGEYFIVAYLFGGDFGGGYTAAVACGLSVDCANHSLLPVVVQAGQVTTGANPADWYAPEGSFPANPVP